MADEQGRELFRDDFRSGLEADRWTTFSGEGFAADGATATSTASGLVVASPQRDAESGAPVFTKTLPGFVCHIQWLVASSETFATGDREIRVHFRAGAQAFGLDRHPYGDAVADPETDFRLGSGTLNVLDFESGMVFDFWISHAAVWMFYERLRPPGAGLEYEAFTGCAGPVRRTPGAMHDFCIAVDAAAGTARWEIDGAVVAAVEEMGCSRPGWTSVLDHGGTPERVRPRQLQVGMGMMTMLDASLPTNNHGLVDLATEADYVGDRPGPAKTFQGGPRLFGQGVELRVESVSVERS